MSILRAVLVSLALITLASVGQVIYAINSSRNICIKNDSLLLQVNSIKIYCILPGFKLMDKIGESGICANECNTTQCQAQCVSSSDVICGTLCVASAFKDSSEVEETCTTKSEQMLKCLHKCARVDNLYDKIIESEICVEECNTAECKAQCISSPDVICGSACIASVEKNPEKEACTTKGNSCYKCLDKCASGSEAISVTSFAIFFSLAISSFMM